MDLTQDDGFVLLVTSNGYGKKVSLCPSSGHRGRGGQGLKSIILSEKTGEVADARTLMAENEEIALVSSDGAGDALRAWQHASDQAGGGRGDHHADGRGRGPAAGGAAGGWPGRRERRRVGRLRGFRTCLGQRDWGSAVRRTFRRDRRGSFV